MSGDEVVKCSKCDQALTVENVSPYFNEHIVCPAELSLLVIDLGDSCVVKVEKGKWPKTLNYHVGCESPIQVLGWPFSVVKEDIDKLEDKPVPRIERATDAERCIVHYLHHGNGNYEPIMQSTLDALSELAGRPLPIHEGKQGTWVKLYTPHLGTEFFPFTAWRYTR